MKFWTIQEENILTIIEKQQTYYPDIYKSRYLSSKSLYNLVLNSFNTLNNMNIKGLIFAFAKNNQGSPVQIENINAFETFIKQNRSVVGCFLKALTSKSIILELNYTQDFNPIYIDFNDFQYLMPPFIPIDVNSENSKNVITNNIKLGQFNPLILPCQVVQAHLPYIKQENIVNTYSMFKID